MYDDETRCPDCGADHSLPLTDGRLCLDCRNEWDPATVDWSTLRHVAPGAVEVAVDAVLQPPDDVQRARDAQAAVDALVGREVVLEGGQHATIVELIDDDWVRVALDDGREEAVTWDTIQRTIESPGSSRVEVDLPDDVAAGLAGTAVRMASLVLEAGASTVTDSPDGPTIGTPPQGWLPAETDIMPMVEMGAAFAVATMIVTLGIPAEEVVRIAHGWRNNADKAETETDE